MRLLSWESAIWNITPGISRLEQRHPETVLLPMFFYGTSSFAVAGPENGRGSIDSLELCRFAENLFSDLLETGFRNIHGFVYHQSENFHQGMPLDLAFRLARRRALFAYQERHSGCGWWGAPAMRDYYDDPQNNIFSRIQIHPLVTEAVEAEFGSDHATCTNDPIQRPQLPSHP